MFFVPIGAEDGGIGKVMSFVLVSKDSGIATVTLSRGKVNALNETMVEQIRDCFEGIENDPEVRAVIFTGRGKFFSFGFDIPEFLNYSKEAFATYLTKFTGLYTYLFLFPKPIVAMLNGHTVAGGCMLATACDCRIMVWGKAKISLNEVTFGSTVFAGSVEILRFCIGDRNAELFLGGNMYSAEEAKGLGLIDHISSTEKLKEDACRIAREYAQKSGPAFQSIKRLLRKTVADEMVKREADSIHEFINIWYSASTRENLEKIKIHS
jgi:3,2-trans-enoyl-CoA isomerase